MITESIISLHLRLGFVNPTNSDLKKIRKKITIQLMYQLV